MIKHKYCIDKWNGLGTKHGGSIQHVPYLSGYINKIRITFIYLLYKSESDFHILTYLPI